jgi:hypothetical protein
MARQEWVCFRECFHLNKLFKPGEKFPHEWIENGYKPNKHFCSPAEYADMRDTEKKTRYQFCAGDDQRSTEELKAALKKYMPDINPKWSRKEIWMALHDREHAEARTGGGGGEEAKRHPSRPPKGM